MKPKYMSIIIWEDSLITNSTQELDDLSVTPVLLTSVGFLVGENNEVVNLSMELPEYGECRHTVTIISKNIVFRRDIRVKTLPTYKELRDAKDK